MHLTSDKSIRAAPWGLPVYHLYCEGASEFVFTDNETNNERLFAAKNASAHVRMLFTIISSRKNRRGKSRV